MDAATSRILWGRMAYDRGRSAAGETQTAGRIRRPGMNHRPVVVRPSRYGRSTLW